MEESTPNGGTLRIGDRTLLLFDTICQLYVGRLDVNFGTPDVDGVLMSLPFGDCVEYSSLTNKHIAIEDCRRAVYENPIFTPYFSIGGDDYSIDSLSVDAVLYIQAKNVLQFDVTFTASRYEGIAGISAAGHISADCIPIIGLDVLTRQVPIPIRFAKHYLPLIGLPEISTPLTRSEVVAQFGVPNDNGGGMHPQFGLIPEWIRYTLPTFFLHFQIESNFITHVTIMQR